MNSNDAVGDTLIPVIDQVLAFMEDALTTKQADDKTISDLRASVQAEKAKHEKVILEKVAAAKKGLIDTKLMGESLARLQGMGVIDERGAEKIATRLKNDVNAAFPLLVKLAENLLSAPGEGVGVPQEGDKEAATGTGKSDPDGWDDFAAGKKVAIKQ